MRKIKTEGMEVKEVRRGILRGYGLEEVFRLGFGHISSVERN